MTIQVSTVPDVGSVGVSSAIDRTTYLSQLLNLRAPLTGLSDETASLVQTVRDRAAAMVQERAIPTTRDEEWRFTDLSALVQTCFTRADAVSLSASDIAAYRLPEAANSSLVFVNGVYAPELSAIADLPAGVVVGNLAHIDPQQLTNYLAQQQGSDEVFTALNTASFTDAAIVWIPRNQSVTVPIHLLFVSIAQAQSRVTQPRCLVVAAPSSQVTLIEDYVGLGEGVAYTNSVTEIWVDANAQVTHTRVQRDTAQSFHIGKTAVSQARDSRYSGTAISLGAKVSRHHFEVYQTGEQTDTTMNGLTILDHDQLGDTHSTLALTKPYGTSHQVHKCIVSDRAHAVFNGKISVPKPAQQTNAAQLSRTLLLSPRARIDTKPQLEITADNVKCAHGATVSQLEDDEVFYLQSRGIDEDAARKLLTYAFAIEIIDHIPVASLHDTLAALIRRQTA